MNDERDNINPDFGAFGRRGKKLAFLVAYSQSGNVTLACRAAKCSRQSVLNWRKADEKFELAVQEAAEQAADLLEAEARRRAVEGVEEPVIHQGEIVEAWIGKDGKLLGKSSAPLLGEETEGRMAPLMVRKYSDSLLMFLMRGANPKKYRDNMSHELSGPGGKPIETKQVDRHALRLLSRNPEAEQLAMQFVELMAKQAQTAAGSPREAAVA